MPLYRCGGRVDEEVETRLVAGVAFNASSRALSLASVRTWHAVRLGAGSFSTTDLGHTSSPNRPYGPRGCLLIQYCKCSSCR